MNVRDGPCYAAEGTSCAAEGTQRAADGTQRAAEGTQPAAEGTQPAAEGTQPVADGTSVIHEVLILSKAESCRWSDRFQHLRVLFDFSDEVRRQALHSLFEKAGELDRMSSATDGGGDGFAA